MNPAPSVAVVVNTYNDSHYLREALSSVVSQAHPPNEVVVVDDGSTADPAVIVREFAGVRLIRQPNAGLAAARNRGLAALSSDYVAFLDADDRLLPQALAAGLRCMASHPDAWLVYGAHRRIDQDGLPLSGLRLDRVGVAPYLDLLHRNPIAMHATVLYRRLPLVAAGGFDATLRRCEDYELYLRIARQADIACHDTLVAEYRIHARNMSKDRGAMLRQVLEILELHAKGTEDGSVIRAARRGRQNWRRYYAQELLRDAVEAGRRDHDLGRGVGQLRQAFELDPLGVAHGLASRAVVRVRRQVRRRPALGQVRFGDLGGTAPICDDFGFSRGRPVDRYYIERFLERQAVHIRGRALEVGDDLYLQRFGAGQVERAEVLHVDASQPKATYVGDLTSPTTLPEATFDCMILTQTLHFIFDLQRAVERVYGALKPGGVALVTVPGISPIDRGAWRTTWYWSLTRQAAARLFEPVFGAEHVQLEVYGNVFAATAFLQGLCVEELETRKLDLLDEAYPVTIAVQARKAYS